MVEVTIAGVGAVPLVLALVELIKRTFPEAKKYSQFISLFFGVVVVAAAQGFTQDALFAGLVVGLSASGLWSGAKNTLKK